MLNYLNALYIGIGMILTVLIGFILGILGIFKPNSARRLDKFITEIIHIPLLIYAVGSKKIGNLLFSPFGCACLSSFIIFSFCLMLLFFPISHSEEYISFIHSASTHLNLIVIGIPLFDALWPTDDTAILPLIGLANEVITLPLYSLFFEFTRKTKEPKFTSKYWKDFFISICTSKLFLGNAIGAIWSATGLKFPIAIEYALKFLADGVLSLSLLSIGVFMFFRPFKPANWKAFIPALVVKEVIYPMLIFIFCRLFNVKKDHSIQASFHVTIGCGNAVFLLAKKTRRLPKTSSSYVIWSTILSLPLSILWTFITSTFLEYLEI